MVNGQIKKILAGAAIIIMAPAISYAACQEWDQKVSDAITEVRKTQTGGTANAGKGPDYVDPVVQNARDVVKQAVDAGCNLGPQWQTKDFLAGDGTRTGSEFAPPAPGDNKGASTDVYSTPGESNAQSAGESSLPIAQEKSGSSTAAGSGGGAAAAKNKAAAKSAAGGGGAGSAAASGCGKIANEYGKYLSGLSGAETPTYQAGCAGTNTDNTVRSSADNTGQACSGNQFGEFGLVQAAYNNKYQSMDVSSLTAASPNSTPSTGTVIAAKNNTTGAATEPSGCRLSTYSKCGQIGDVIMVQSKAGATASDPYDKYLIYAGGNSFYQVQNSGGKAVVKAALPAAYTGASYAAVRQTCSGGASTAGSGASSTATATSTTGQPGAGNYTNPH